MATITVGPSGRDYTLPQAAINAAADGDEIVLDSGVTFTETLHLPFAPHTTPVKIRSSIAAPNRRVVAADLSNMARLRPGHPSEACVTGAGVNGWEFEFVCFDSPGGFYNHVYLYNENLGGGSFRNTQNITFDRILIVGSNPDSTRTGLYLNGSATIDRCHIANIHKAGEESKAIVLQEGPGPFTITDNFLEGASVNVLFGGGDTQSAAHIPDNILIENNHFFKNPAWNGGPYGIKNIFELKTAKHVTVRNNLCENNWTGAQDGFGILFQPVNDTASSPWNVIEDVLFEHNTIISESGINILGYEWQPAYNSGQCTRVTFRNNLWTIANYFLKASGEVGVLTIEHETINNAGRIGAFSAGWIHPAGESHRPATCAIEEFTFRNNLLYCNEGLVGEGTSAGMDTLTTFCPTGLTWTHNVLANKIGGESYPSVTTHPSTATHQANFVDLIDYQLTGGSAYRNAGQDALDLGWTGFIEGTSGAGTASGSCTVLGVSTAVASGIAIGTAINNGAYGVEDTSISWLFNAEGHPLLVTVRGDYTADDVTSVTYFGVPGALLGKVAVAGARWTYLYGWLTPAAGTNTVIVTASSGHYLFGCAVSYQNVVAFGSVVTATQGTPTTDFAISLTTALVNSWVSAAIGSEEANFGAGSGTTLRSRFTTFLDPGFVDNSAAVPASTNVTLNVNTSSANRWVGIAVELIAAATVPANSATAAGTSTAAAVGRAISSAVATAIATAPATAIRGTSDAFNLTTYALTIGGVPQLIRSGTLRITETLNGRNTLDCEIVSWNGSYRPAMGDEVIYTEDATRLFGGLIDLPAERGLVNQMGTRIVNVINAVDFNAYADRRHINGIIPAGSLKAALQVIVPYLADYGVTLDGAQVDGPAVPLLYLPTRLIRDVLDELSVMTGYAWEIDYHRVLRMFLPGSMAAPFNVVPNADPSVITGDITVNTERTDPANRIILLAGSGILETTQAFVGDGTTRVFTLRVAVTGIPTTVTVNGAAVTVGTHGVDTALEWTVRYSDNAIVQLAEAPPGTGHSPLTGADTLSVVYAGQYPYQVTADDLADQAINDVWEKSYQADKIFEVAAAQALADGYLPKHVRAFKKVRYPTRRRGLKPGQTQTITVPQRDALGTFLIIDKDTTDTADQQFQHVITAVGGTVIPLSWRDFFKQGGGVTGGSATPVPGGGVSGGGTTGQIIWAGLGGSRSTSVAKDPAVWWPVPDFQAYVARTSFAGLVRADCWAREAGTSVQLRLRRRELNIDWSDATTTAASVVVTSMTPIEVTFTAAITAGKTYRLELISSVNGSGVYGIGSLESA